MWVRVGWDLRGGFWGRDKILSFRNAKNKTKVGFYLVIGAFYINHWEGSRVNWDILQNKISCKNALRCFDLVFTGVHMILKTVSGIEIFVLSL